MQNYKISNYYRNVLRFFWLLQLFVKIKKKHKFVHAHNRITQTCVFIMTHYFSIPHLAHQSAIDRPALEREFTYIFDAFR